MRCCKRKYFLLLLMCFPCLAHAQSKDGRDMLKVILSTLKEVGEVSYAYNMSITYPDGNFQKLNGHVYLNNSKTQMVNDNNLQTVIYTGKWSYRADHTEKEVVIVNNEKHVNKEHKRQMEQQIFQNGSLGAFLDSVVMKNASIKNYKSNNDTIHVDLSFPAGSVITGMSMDYDNEHKKLIAYSMVTFYPWEGSTGKNIKGTTNSINCNHFNNKDSYNEYSIDNYFVLNNGKLTLKKYTSYKLNSKL